MKTFKSIILVTLAVAMAACSNGGEEEALSMWNGSDVVLKLTAEEQTLADALNGFDRSILPIIDQCSADRECNLLVSPLGMRVMLGMLANGGSDDAREEILNVLGCRDLKTLNGFNKKLIDTLSKFDSKTKRLFKNDC